MPVEQKKKNKKKSKFDSDSALSKRIFLKNFDL